MQSKLSSIIEQLLNVGSGFIISLLVWIYIIIPIWNFDVNFSDNILITVTFTGISIIRGYVWRRLFNKITIKKI